ncbi:hypothetical protein C2G38_2253110 [Gigaspora rosea]|uniref:Uncharacterized protein n=1 Tax=Gigaspora rosea TaxID=44941 RepID=A0A397U8Y2_9GLOM|nr:hypothetical protein C2G38_2253110 [Gigaspora rosea]CAG8814796.1 4658_t:CDS:1 [Gigaspora rosea]
MEETGEKKKKRGNVMSTVYAELMKKNHSIVIEPGRYYYLILTKANAKTVSEMMYPFDLYDEKEHKINVIHYFNSLHDICANVLGCDQKKAGEIINEIFYPIEFKKQRRITDHFPMLVDNAEKSTSKCEQEAESSLKRKKNQKKLDFYFKKKQKID